MLISFITALAWLIAVVLGGWTMLLFFVAVTAGGKLKIGLLPLLLIFGSVAWLIARYTA